VSKIVAIRSQVGFDETIPYLLSGCGALLALREIKRRTL
jgi:hypothetical protein